MLRRAVIGRQRKRDSINTICTYYAALGSDYVAGEYSIADMALFCWMRLHKGQGQSLSDYPHVKRWLDAIYARPAVVRGLDLLRDRRTNYAAENDKRDELLAQLERGEAAG